jgi:hypothetical protein
MSFDCREKESSSSLIGMRLVMVGFTRVEAAK